MQLHPSYWKWLIPDFPTISHFLPPTSGDSGRILTDSDRDYLLNQHLYIEEKLDGANCGMAYTPDGVGIIRNRTHVLSKNYSQGKRPTPAKSQFLRAWNWIAENRPKFEQLQKMIGEPVGVYGEWCLFVHGIRYEILPDLFMAYSIYQPSAASFLPVQSARELLQSAGFATVALIHEGFVGDVEQLVALANQRSVYSDLHEREGLVIKTEDGFSCKLVRPGYVQNSAWNDKIGILQPSWDS